MDPRPVTAPTTRIAESPSGHSLSQPTIAAVRKLLHAARDERRVGAHVASAARLIAEDARYRGLRAEQMVIHVKDVWAALTEVRQAGDVLEQQQLLSRLITHCIDEYYAPSDGAVRGAS